MAIVAPAKQVGRSLVEWDPSAAEPMLALRAAIGVAVTLGVAELLGGPSWTAAALTGAWSAGIPLLSAGVRPRPALSLMTGAAVAVALLLGGLAGPSPTATIIVAIVWAVLMAMIGSIGTTPSVISTVCGVALVLAPSLTHGGVLSAALAALVAGAVQAAASLLPPWRRFSTERQALADALRAVAVDATVLANAMDTPLSTQALHDARIAVDKRPKLPDALRETVGALYELRAAIIAVAAARSRLADEDPTAARHTAQVLRNTTIALDMLARSVERLDPVDEEWEKRLASAVEASPDPETPRHVVAGQEIRRLHRAVHRLARLAERTVQSEPATAEVARRVHARSRLAEDWESLRANMTTKSPSLRHALRAAATIAIATAAGWYWPGSHGYWIPLTAWIVLKPDFATTIGRGLARILGTAAGGWIASMLAIVVTGDMWWTALVVVLYAAIAYLTMPVSYVVYSVVLAGFSVFQIDLAGQSPVEAAWERGLSTVVGGLLALLLYVVWPSWKTRELPDLLADLIEAYRTYANLVLDMQARPADRDEAALRAAQDEVRLRRVELSEAVDKASAEPIGGPPPHSYDVEDVEAALSKADRSLIVLEGNVKRTDAAALPGVDEFRDAVDASYERLAAWVRTGMRRPAVDLTGALSALDDSLESGTDATLRRRRLLDWETDILVEALSDANLIVAEWGKS